MSQIIYDANFNGPEAVPFIGEAEKYHYVYLIVNTLNQSIYIGVHSTKKLNDGYMSSSGYVHEDIDKFGIENFKKYNLFYFNTRKEALDKETELVNKEFCQREDVYNIAIGGKGTKLAKMPEELRERLSKARTGTKRSKETREKMSKASKGRRVSEETKEKISKANKGRKHTPESIEKMSKIKIGKKKSKETREKMSKASKGRKHSKETKERLSKLQKGKKASKETREKMSKANKGENNPMYGRRGENSPFFGEKNPTAKAILKFDLNNNFICEFSTIKDAAFNASMKYGTFYGKLKSGVPINGFYYRFKE